MPSMIVNKKLVPALKRVVLAATTVFALAQCSEEEVVSTAPEAESSDITSTAVSPLTLTSLTVAGINTAFATAQDCKTCTFVVPEGTELIDGKEFGFKPGDVICLNAALKYTNLEIVNLEGTEESPIVITTVGAEQTISATSVSESDPY